MPFNAQNHNCSTFGSFVTILNLVYTFPMAYVRALPGANCIVQPNSGDFITLRNRKMVVNTTVWEHLTGFRQQIFVSARQIACSERKSSFWERRFAFWGHIFGFSVRCLKFQTTKVYTRQTKGSFRNRVFQSPIFFKSVILRGHDTKIRSSSKNEKNGNCFF